MANRVNRFLDDILNAGGVVTRKIIDDNREESAREESNEEYSTSKKKLKEQYNELLALNNEILDVSREPVVRMPDGTTVEKKSPIDNRPELRLQMMDEFQQGVKNLLNNPHGEQNAQALEMYYQLLSKTPEYTGTENRSNTGEQRGPASSDTGGSEKTGRGANTISGLGIEREGIRDAALDREKNPFIGLDKETTQEDLSGTAPLTSLQTPTNGNSQQDLQSGLQENMDSEKSESGFDLSRISGIFDGLRGEAFQLGNSGEMLPEEVAGWTMQKAEEILNSKGIKLPAGMNDLMLSILKIGG